MTEDESKLQIDDDWKNEAATDKERLARNVEGEQQGSPGDLGDAGFSGIVQMLAMQAMVGLGGLRGPDGKDIPPNLELAKLHVDMLDALDTKTAGNLTPNEKRLLDTTLHQLRMAYVEVARGGVPAPPTA